MSGGSYPVEWCWLNDGTCPSLLTADDDDDDIMLLFSLLQRLLLLFPSSSLTIPRVYLDPDSKKTLTQQIRFVRVKPFKSWFLCSNRIVQQLLIIPFFFFDKQRWPTMNVNVRLLLKIERILVSIEWAEFFLVFFFFSSLLSIPYWTLWGQPSWFHVGDGMLTKMFPWMLMDPFLIGWSFPLDIEWMLLCRGHLPMILVPCFKFRSKCRPSFFFSLLASHWSTSILRS